MGISLGNSAVPTSDALTEATLTPERWQEIKEIFGRVLDADANQRDSLLQEECRGDESLISEVSSLLAASEDGNADTSKVLKIPSPAECLTVSAKDPILGRRVGDYKIERRIGLGGVAAVYL